MAAAVCGEFGKFRLFGPSQEKNLKALIKQYFWQEMKIFFFESMKCFHTFLQKKNKSL